MAGQRDADRQFLALVEEGDYWARAAQLGAEDLLFNGGGKGKYNALDLAYRPCTATMPETAKIKRACLWSANIAAILGREEISRDTQGLDGGASYLQKLEPKLLSLLTSELSPPERAEAGIALARLGDPREYVLSLEHMEFCFVPKGPFYMGSPMTDEMADHYEKTDDLIRQMEYDFWISRFPITNAQFKTFVEAGGYDEMEFWAEAKAAKVWRDGAVQDFFDKERRTQPYDFGTPFNLSNHAVVGVTWYEALAFARWLKKKYLAKGWIDESMEIMLPSEAEWEKAARGGMHIPDPKKKIIRPIHDLSNVVFELQENALPQRRYPWGNDADSDRANYDDSGIDKTSAAGCFAQGASPYGCEEMSGNVWEWTRSLWRDYPYVDRKEERKKREDLGASLDAGRVLRGGAPIAFETLNSVFSGL